MIAVAKGGGQLTCSGFDRRDRFSSQSSRFPLFVLALFVGATPSSFAARSPVSRSTRRPATFSKNMQPDKKRQVGSLTKIATAMVVLDWAAKARRRSRPSRGHSGGRLCSGRARTISASNRATRSRCATCFTPRSCSPTTSPLTALANHVGRALQGQLAR